MFTVSFEGKQYQVRCETLEEQDRRPQSQLGLSCYFIIKGPHNPRECYYEAKFWLDGLATTIIRSKLSERKVAVEEIHNALCAYCQERLTGFMPKIIYSDDSYTHEFHCKEGNGNADANIVDWIVRFIMQAAENQGR